MTEDLENTDDQLAAPHQARLFDAVRAFTRPASTREIAERVGRHPNTVRLGLQRLAGAGLIEQRSVRGAMGRPRQEWVIAAHAHGLGRHGEGRLGAWLARAFGTGASIEAVERTGREIGREIAPDRRARGVEEAMGDALDTLGFAPSAETRADGIRFVLGFCPYRDAVRANPAVVCSLHRGITRGLLDRLSPETPLTDFVARDPDSAGCLIELGAA